jgi:hypothetical protein
MTGMPSSLRCRDVEHWLAELFIAAEGTRLRTEDLRKAREVAALLDEIERALLRCSRERPTVLVDAAAGKSYVGLLAAKLLIEPSGRDASVIAIEREPRRAELSRLAADRLATRVPVECRAVDVGEPSAWPSRPSIVTALHACGAAADEIIDRAVAVEARHLLLVPCCTGRGVAAASRAAARAEHLAVPRHAPVRRRFIQAMVGAERTWRLEAAGYETEVVEFVAPTVTPHNLLWRARLVGEPTRMRDAAENLRRIQASGLEP